MNTYYVLVIVLGAGDRAESQDTCSSMKWEAEQNDAPIQSMNWSWTVSPPELWLCDLVWLHLYPIAHLHHL